MKYLITIVAAAFVLAGCGGEETPEPVTPEASSHDLFFDNLASLCGERFTGGAVYPEDSDHDLVDTELNVHVRSCDVDKIEVDLFRDGNTWHATWMLEKRENGLHLYHDHIGEKEYAEGEEPLTGYGGYADDRGSATQQYFPADEHTAEILPEATTNVWMMDMDLESGTFVYNLDRHGEQRFRAVLTHVTE